MAPAIWTNLSSWQTCVRLDPGTSALTIEGLDRNNNVLSNSSVSIQIVYLGSNRWPSTAVVINEWMANNMSTIEDPVDATFQGWFELYNPGECPFDLSGYYLTDNLTNKSKWLIPSGTILPAAGFLLVWADSHSSENVPYGDLHASFMFNQSTTNSIGLFTPDLNPVDQVTFGPQGADLSGGRFPDGQSIQATNLFQASPRSLNCSP